MFHIGRVVPVIAIFSKIKKIQLKMSALQRVLSNNKTAEELLEIVKSELCIIRNELIWKKKTDLIKENAILLKQIEAAKAQLVLLENQHGKKQIPLPGEKISSSENQASIKVERQPEPEQSKLEGEPQQKPQKEKKPKKEKPATSGAENKKNIVPVAEAPIDVGRLDFRVGKIIDVSKHPDADSLYLEKIDCGEPNPRTVVSGLVKFVPIEEMRDRMVVVLCNLKPAKMRGITSEAMVMCASTTEKVEVLSPPTGSVPGDLVHCEGYERNPDAQLNPKKKVFETCAPDLMTNENLMACYKNAPLHVPGKGNVVAKSLKNVHVK